MKGIKELSSDILLAWSEGANIAVPDAAVRAPWLPQLADLAKMIQQGSITVDDIRDFVREKCKDSWNRSRPQTWSLRAVSRDIYAWTQTRETNKKAPPPDFKPHKDHLGRVYVWDWHKGKVICVEPNDPSSSLPATQVIRHSKPYKSLGLNEKVVKRQGVEGLTRDFFMMGDDSQLTEDETRKLLELTDDS